MQIYILRREPNLRFNGTDTECNVVLKNVKREHSGTWICGQEQEYIEQEQEYIQNRSSSIQIGVGQYRIKFDAREGSRVGVREGSRVGVREGSRVGVSEGSRVGVGVGVGIEEHSWGIFPFLRLRTSMKMFRYKPQSLVNPKR